MGGCSSSPCTCHSCPAHTFRNSPANCSCPNGQSHTCTDDYSCDMSSAESVWDEKMSTQQTTFITSREKKVEAIETLSMRIYGGHCDSDPTADPTRCHDWVSNDNVGYCKDRTYTTEQDCTSRGHTWFKRALTDIHTDNISIIQSRRQNLEAAPSVTSADGAAACSNTYNGKLPSLHDCQTQKLSPAEEEKKGICNKQDDCSAVRNTAASKGWAQCTCSNGIYQSSQGNKICPPGEYHCSNCNEGYYMKDKYGGPCLPHEVPPPKGCHKLFLDKESCNADSNCTWFKTHCVIKNDCGEKLSTIPYERALQKYAGQQKACHYCKGGCIIRSEGQLYCSTQYNKKSCEYMNTLQDNFYGCPEYGWCD